MVIAGVFFQGLQMFSDVGIGPSIIQNKRGEPPHFYNTAWTIQVFRGYRVVALCFNACVADVQALRPA